MSIETTSTQYNDNLLYSREQILKLVSKGNTKEAMWLLTKSGNNEALKKQKSFILTH